MSIIPRATIDLCFSTMSLRESFDERLVAGEVTVIDVCLIVIPFRQRFVTCKFFIFPRQYANKSLWTSSTSRNKMFDKDVSSANGRGCVGPILCLVVFIPLLHLSVKQALSIWSSRRFSTIPDHACAWRSPMHTCREIKHYTGTVQLGLVFSGGALTCST